MGDPICEKDWGAPDPISEEGIAKVSNLLRTGRLHRYQGGQNHVSEAESAMADYLQVPFALGLNSGGSAIFLALKLAGVTVGTPVMTNCYTLTPVPGAILHAGGVPVLVECSSESFQIDLESLKEQQAATGARHLLLCYMRGKLPDMEGILQFCRERDVTLVEDCAHVLGSKWRGKALGTLGLLGCYSTQTNKLINSGEGGLLVTSNEKLMATAVIHSGSYGHFHTHIACPEDEELMLEAHASVPNFSLRMTPLAALLILDQLPKVEAKIEALNRNYAVLEAKLGALSCLRFPARLSEERHVGSSFQFQLLGQDYVGLESFKRCCVSRGVKVAWFGAKEVSGFTSCHRHWTYVGRKERPATEALLTCLFDIPLYHTMSWKGEEMERVADIIVEEALKLTKWRKYSGTN